MRKFVFTLVLLILCGCIHKISSEQIEQTLVKGRSTKQDVIALLGEPRSKQRGTPYVEAGTLDTGAFMNKKNGKSKSQKIEIPSETWIFSGSRSDNPLSFSGITVMVMFNAKGTVINYIVNEMSY